MSEDLIPILTGPILEEQTGITLGELCRSCSVHAELVVQMVEHGILDPSGRDLGEWRFPGDSLRRVHRALRLQRDLEINLAGLAMVLDLLDEVEALRRRVWLLDQGCR